MPHLKLYNSLTRKKDDFHPVNPECVCLYACGPTVYSYAHIGNARMAVAFDILNRVLKYTYPKVRYVSNITDVDDKIMAAAEKSGTPINEITTKYADIYNKDMASLGVEPPDIQPRATEHIGEMIALIEKLIERGHAYVADGHVLFDVPSFPAYGGLSGRNRDEQIAGARVEIAPYKKDAADFILWKPSKEDQPGWDSPWGRGRPGWHIECSAMAEKHLGLPFDIHGGGADLKFPHHENEIAQSCCAHSHENDLSAFAKFWVHNGFVTVEGEKMSKSLGNVVLAHDLLEQGIEGETIRMALLSAHYRQPLDWTDDGLKQAKKTLSRFYKTLYDLKEIEPEDKKEAPKELLEALYDDLNTPKAMAALSALVKKAGAKKTPRLKGQVLAAGKLLGVLQSDPATWLGYDQKNAEIDALLDERFQARKDKNFTRADEIRDQIVSMGIIIEDTADSTKWRRV